jgi:hypothetical protein
MRPTRLALLAAFAAVVTLAACGDARPVEGEQRLAGEECTTCHGFPPPPGAFGTPSVAHPANARCWDCHSETVAVDNVLIRDGRHLDGIVNVGGRGEGCAACHGFPPETGAHPLHAKVGCARCHTGYTQESTDPALHGNGVGDAIVVPLTGGTLRVEGWENADCTACHTALFGQ